MNAERPSPRSILTRRLIGTALLLVGFCAIGWVVWNIFGRPSVRAERLLQQAHDAQRSGDLLQAEELALNALQVDFTRQDALLLAAQCAAGRGDFERAASCATRVQTDDPAIQLRAALLAARLFEQRLYEFSNAEQAYRSALDVDPDHAGANEGLAKLLGLCGRRREAIPYILRLVRHGEPTDLLMMLSRENVVVQEPDLLAAAHEAAPRDPSPLVGLAWHAAEKNQTERAIRLLQEAIALSPDHAAAHVALGQQLLSAGHFDELVNWAEQIPAEADGFPGSWLVRARMAEQQHDAPSAIRCYLEAARLAPESKPANLGLIRLLAESGQAAVSEEFAQHLHQLQELEIVQNQVLFPNDFEGVEPLLVLSQSYEAAGRLWEARGWCALAVSEDPLHPRALQYFGELREKTEGIPLRMTVDSTNPALAVNLSDYPVPDFRDLSIAASSTDSSDAPPISFQNDADSSGLIFRYFNGVDGSISHRMYELTGGGIAILDMDRDDFIDAFFTQGCAWPPGRPDESHRDRLFRNSGGERFHDVTEAANIREAGFGQGASVGDFNGDGFPDLYVANIGSNRLWVNNGDGTFTDATVAAGLDGESWTTSCVLADLDGDALPDIYDANYLTGDDVFARVCQHADGSPRQCMPFHFEGAVDRLWINNHSGGFIDATRAVLPVEPRGKGLGLAVWDAGGQGQLSLFVANDTTPNLFFSPRANDDGDRMIESGVVSGLALNDSGKSEGCMGVAIGDIDEDGRIDIHVTNFLAESNTLYINVRAGSYRDATRSTGLESPTLNFLGFGTQFLDADLDGRLELFVTNGHVDQLPDKPYRMLPQWFRWNGRTVDQVRGIEVGPYFQQAWLGRSAARVDWNRDGREDLLVGHLADDSALLTNTTSPIGRSLSIRLIGVQSSRDAVGTTVRARIGERTIVRQLTAGDGYQASNERRIHFGVNADTIDELTVNWPSGAVQRFESVATDQRLILTEGGSLRTSPRLSSAPD